MLFFTYDSFWRSVFPGLLVLLKLLHTACVRVFCSAFSRQYPATIINTVSVILQDIKFSFQESPSLDFHRTMCVIHAGSRVLLFVVHHATE